MMFLGPPGHILEYRLMEVVKHVVCVPSMGEDTMVTVHQGEVCVFPGSQARSGMWGLHLGQVSIYCLSAPDPPFSALICDATAGPCKHAFFAHLLNINFITGRF